MMCIKSKAVSKPISITLLMLYSVPALLTTVYAYYSCFFTTYSCNQSFWLVTMIIVMVIYFILVSIQIIYIQHKNSALQQPATQPQPQQQPEPPTLPSNTIIMPAPTQRKSIPMCPEVSGSNVKAPTAMIDCLSAGLVYVDGACAPPQEYGIVPGEEYLKRCQISCGENYMTLDGKKKLCSL